MVSNSKRYGGAAGSIRIVSIVVSVLMVVSSVTQPMVYAGVQGEVLESALSPLQADAGIVVDLSAVSKNYDVIVSGEMQSVRDVFAQALHETDPERQKALYQSQQERVNRIVARLTDLVAAGVKVDSPILNLYYLAKVMLKPVKASEFLFINGQTRCPTQVLVLDEEKYGVLTFKRGPYKRLFADKWSVSVNAKGTEPRVLADAISRELGIAVDADRIEIQEKVYTDQMIAYDFYALTAQEETTLQAEAQKMAAIYSNPVTGIAVEYDARKRAVIVYSLSDNVAQEQVKAVADKLTEATRIPYIYPVLEKNESRLAVYVLTKEEREQLLDIKDNARDVKRMLQKKIESGDNVSEEELKVWDSDEIHFRSVRDILQDYDIDPCGFALDLFMPYLEDRELWKRLQGKDHDRYIIPVNSKWLDDQSLAGGKGGNMKRLQELEDRLNRMEGVCLRVPKTAAVSIASFDELVLGNKAIVSLIEKLDMAQDSAEKKSIAAKIRKAIVDITLPEEFMRQVQEVFQGLGGSIAVRSSANVEDIKDFSASGLGDSFLHVTTLDETYIKIKEVWASLFSDGFIKQREKRGIKNDGVKMAVVLQEFVDAESAGVLNSYDVSSFRSVYKVVSNWGLGETIVQGEGQHDSWAVGINAHDVYDVLEENVARKTKFLVSNTGHPVELDLSKDVRELNDEERAFERKKDEKSLTREDVLYIAQVAKEVHRLYRTEDWAAHIDLEFAKSKDGQIYVVQTRPLNVNSYNNKRLDSCEVLGAEISDAKKDGDENKSVVAKKQSVEKKGTQKVLLTVVDDARVPAGVPTFELSKGVTAQFGTVTAKLLVTEEIPTVDAAQGVIVVTANTNNQWNGVFSSFKGVITQQGKEVAHATNNARENNIPCVVGVPGAMDMLKDYNGAEVTFDAFYRKIYIGRMPVKEIEIETDFWVNDFESLETLGANFQPHELHQNFSQLMKVWNKVFLQFYDGNFRRRSATYEPFQIDFYYLAWDRLTEYLNEKYKDRRPFELKTQKRIIRDGGLLNQVVSDDQATIYHFIKGLSNLCVDDLWELYEERFAGLERFSSYFADLESVSPENIDEVMERLTEGFMWMHFAYWLAAVSYELFVKRQTVYISDQFQAEAQKAAVAQLTEERYFRNLSRERDAEICAITEIIREDAGLRSVQNARNAHEFALMIEDFQPQLHQRIKMLANMYKNTTEDIRVLDETAQCYAAIYEEFNSLNFNEELVLLVLRNVLRQELITKDIKISDITLKDETFACLLRAYARHMAVSERLKGSEGNDLRRRLFLLNNLSLMDIAPFLDQAFQKLLDLDAGNVDEEDKYYALLENYPQLVKVLQLDKVERVLREDGHHIAIRAQRPLAKALFRAAEENSFFDNAEDILGYSVAEVSEIIKKGNPSYIKQSKIWRQKAQQADHSFCRAWERKGSKNNNAKETMALLMPAYFKYLSGMNEAIEIIKKMIDKTDPDAENLRQWYESEIVRLRGRMADAKLSLDKLLMSNGNQLYHQRRAMEDLQRSSEKLEQLLKDGSAGAAFEEFLHSVEKNRQHSGRELLNYFPIGNNPAIVDLIGGLEDKVKATLNAAGAAVSPNVFVAASDAVISLAIYERNRAEDGLRIDVNRVKEMVKENAGDMWPFVVKLIGPRLMPDGYVILEYEMLSPEIQALREDIETDLDDIGTEVVEKAAGMKVENEKKARVSKLTEKEIAAIKEKALSEARAEFAGFDSFIPDIYHSTLVVLKDCSIAPEELQRLDTQFQKIRDDIAFQQPQIFLVDSIGLGEVNVATREFVWKEETSLLPERSFYFPVASYDEDLARGIFYQAA